VSFSPQPIKHGLIDIWNCNLLGYSRLIRPDGLEMNKTLNCKQQLDTSNLKLPANCNSALAIDIPNLHVRTGIFILI
jgi:hypothetical protein